MLKIENLNARIGDTDILRGVNLEVNAGEVHAIKARTAPAKARSRR